MSQRANYQQSFWPIGSLIIGSLIIDPLQLRDSAGLAPRGVTGFAVTARAIRGCGHLGE
jgi:hypothetical protein